MVVFYLVNNKVVFEAVFLLGQVLLAIYSIYSGAWFTYF